VSYVVSAVEYVCELSNRKIRRVIGGGARGLAFRFPTNYAIGIDIR